MNWTITRAGTCATLLLLPALLTGCGQAPVRPQTTYRTTPPQASTRLGSEVVAIARSQLGTPYDYGGDDPRGFDCSGLVYYAYHRAGVNVPRTTSEQRQDAIPVSLARLRPGDVVFFRVSRRKPSHVGIYAGHGRFIHSPSTGKVVSYASLDNPYWRKRIVGAGRFR